MQWKRFKLLFPNHHEKLSKMAVLVVGVGGIGCEVLKCLSRAPIRKVAIVDLDTIETSNLNRQFLFRKEHTGHSKSLTAKQSLKYLCPWMNIEAYHCAIQQKTVDFFMQFDLVVLALDNFQARTYVNQLCVVLGIPMADAGTGGYLGQVQFINPYVTACYSCEAMKQTQQVFAVCTIRRKPEKPIHCIVWAKFVFQMLFGPTNNDNQMTDLEQFAQEVRKPDVNTVDRIIQFLFSESVKAGLSQTQQQQVTLIPNSTLAQSPQEKPEYLDKLTAKERSCVLTIGEHIQMFRQSLIRLIRRVKNENCIPFEKDDDDIMCFITAAANLRMSIFRIAPQSYFSVKGMAGNIIPAIASTNSIASGLQIIESYKFLMGQLDKMRKLFIQNEHRKIMSDRGTKPRPNCSICGPTYKPVLYRCDFTTTKLHDIINLVRKQRPELEQFSINDENKNEVYSSAEEQNKLLEKPFSLWTRNKVIQLTLMNDDTFETICSIFVADSQLSHVQNVQMLKQHKMVQTANIIQEATVSFKEKMSDGKAQVEIDFDESEEQLEILEVPVIQKRLNDIVLDDVEKEAGEGTHKKFKTD